MIQKERIRRFLPYTGKRAQATTFIILGIVLLAVIILLWFLRGQFFFGAIGGGGNDIDSLDDHIGTCVKTVAPEYLDRIGLQGGYLATPVDTFRKREDVPISYLCYNMEDTPLCYNRYLTKTHMETELSEAIQQGLSTCLNLKKFARGFTVNAQALDVATSIGDYATRVTVHLPVTIQQDGSSVTQDEFITVFPIPLGVLYNLAQDIVNKEAEIGDFEQLSYMLTHKGQFIIDKKKPYPDKLYILQAKDSDYIFQFFVQGETA